MDKLDEFVTLLYEVNNSHPELRIGQTLVSAAYAGLWVDDDIFYCPDDTLIIGLRKLAGKINK